MITRMDRNVGRIFEMLKQSGIDEETIVFFTSDNGPSGGQGAPDFFNASGGLGGLKSSLCMKAASLSRLSFAGPEK